MIIVSEISRVGQIAPNRPANRLQHGPGFLQIGGKQFEPAGGHLKIKAAFPWNGTYLTDFLSVNFLEPGFVQPALYRSFPQPFKKDPALVKTRFQVS